MPSILTLAIKDLKLIWRDRFGLFWIFAFPLIYALFFGALFSDNNSGSGKIAVVVCDEDKGEAAKRFVERLAKHDSIALAKGKDGQLLDVPRERAIELVRKGDKTAFIRIRKGFEAEGAFGMFVPSDGAEPRLEVGIDPARRAEAGYLRGILMEQSFRGLNERFADSESMRRDVGKLKQRVTGDKDLSPAQKLVLSTFFSALDRLVSDSSEAGLAGPASEDFATRQVEIADVARARGQEPHSSFEITFPSAILWGLIGCAAGFAIMIVRERNEGTLLRLRVSPLSQAQILAGKGLGCFLACVIVIVFVLGVGKFALGVRIGNPALLAVAIVSTSLCFVGLMMAISVLGKTEQAVAGAGWGVMMPFAMLGGGMVPLIAMPSWLQTASNASPFKWGILAIEGAIWRGFSFGDMLLPCGILIASGALFFALGVFVFRRSEI